MCVAGTSIAHKMGMNNSELIRPKLKVSVADNSGLQLAGAAFVTITGPAGSTNQLVYFADNVEDFFLSKQALVELHIISPHFPAPTTVDRRTAQHPPTSLPRLGNLGGSPDTRGVYSNTRDPNANPHLTYVRHHHPLEQLDTTT